MNETYSVLDRSHGRAMSKNVINEEGALDEYSKLSRL